MPLSEYPGGGKLYKPQIGLHKENYALTVDLGVLLFKVNHVAETDGL